MQNQTENPKKTWQEPEIIVLDVEGGGPPNPREVTAGIAIS
ncbi:hypothetical protein V7S79_11695 [Aquirufa sp. ROCK-SH2]